MLFFKLFFIAATIFHFFWCCHSTENKVSNNFSFEDGKLVADCFNEDSNECLIQFTTYQFINKLHLRGFVFDEENIKQFSKAICNMQIQELTLAQCDISDELISLLTLPFNLKSIRLERLNLSFKGIQSTISKLRSSLESLEIVGCLVSKLPQEEPLINSTSQKVSFDFSKFYHLKNIHVDNLNENFDSYRLLLSLSWSSLERIKISCIHLSTEEWALLLDKWNETNRLVFSNTLKEFNIKIKEIEKHLLIQLIRFLFSIPCLEIISLQAVDWVGIDSLPPLPSSIKQLSLIPFSMIFMEDGEISFYNSKNLSLLTHLTVNESFDTFPYYLFDLKELEYLYIWSGIFSNFSLVANKRCDKLKHLSIQSKYLIPLLANFVNNFPVIERLNVLGADSESFDYYLKIIISSTTLKCLAINYYDNKQNYLKIEDKITSSVEELKLTNVWWKFACDFFKVERFPCLKKIYIVTLNDVLDLNEILEKLSSFLQLTSLTLIGKFSLSYEPLQFTFENLKFFRLEVSNSLNLDHLLGCMPNLIELQLEGLCLRELLLQNPIGIRYLSLPFNVLLRNEDFINIVKNIPYLIQVSNHWISLFQSVTLPSELAYYFKELKVYFQNELQFKINPNCLPIKQLKNDDKLINLVRLKSSKLQNYLSSIFPLETSKSFVKQLFTIEFGKYFNGKSIDNELMKRFFNLLGELEITSEKEALFVQNLLFEGKNESFIGLTDFSLENFTNLFSDYFIKVIEIDFESVHLEFIKEFFKANKKYGLFKIFNFLKSLFTSFSVNNGWSKMINNEIFDFFSDQLLAPSFCLFFDRIKENTLIEEKKKFLPSKFESIAEGLNNLEQEQYNEFSINFKSILIEFCDELFIKSCFDILEAILIPETKCAICLDSLFTKECEFFKAKNGNCHFFHRGCLNEWLKVDNTCPHCRRSK